VDGRPNRRNKAAFSNFSGAVRTLPYSFAPSDPGVNRKIICRFYLWSLHKYTVKVEF